MLEIVKGSFLELSPQTWAVLIVVALVVIEYFQLGPHTFTRKPKKNYGGVQRTPGLSKKRKDKVKRRKKDPVVKIDISGPINAPISVIVISGYEGQKLVINNGSVIQAQSAVSGPGNSDYYAVAYGDEAEVSVLDRLEHLWFAGEGSKVKDILLYSWMIPSTFALQKMVSLLKDLPGANKANVGILYDREGEEDEMSNCEEKEDYLRKHGITLERRDTIST